MLPGASSLRRAARVPQRGPLRDRLGRGRRGAGVPGGGARVHRDADRVRRADRDPPARPAGARRDARRGQQRPAARDPDRPRSRTSGRVAPEHISYGKFNNVRMATDVARRARALLGANGITLEYPVMRHLVNLESVLTYEGTHQIHTLVLGRALTGHAAFE